MNYHNEFDPHAAQWIRELITAGDIPQGYVDDRSITEVEPSDLDGYTQCHFFAGIGGWPHALALAGWSPARSVWSASLPCQPFSAAGKRKGHSDERHLWPVFWRLVEKCRPPIIVGEQVASADGRDWLAAVFDDLELLGYACAGADLCAAGVGAPHIRQRLFWVAISDSVGCQGWESRPGSYSTQGASGAGGLAYSEAGRRSEIDSVTGRRDEGNGAEGCKRPEYCGSAGGLGNSKRERVRRNAGTGTEAQRGEGLRAVGNMPGSSGEDGAVGGVSDTAGNGQKQRFSEKRLLAESENDCGWDDVVYVPCADGKHRPLPRIAESGSQSVADGLLQPLVRSGDTSSPGVETTAEARVMRLKGYGNAIVAPLAAEFLRAVMDIIDE